jgi:hypothetical protein
MHTDTIETNGLFRGTDGSFAYTVRAPGGGSSTKGGYPSIEAAAEGAAVFIGVMAHLGHQGWTRSPAPYRDLYPADEGLDDDPVLTAEGLAAATIPVERAQPDRRQGPRRQLDAGIHYGILNVVAAAEAWFDSFDVASWPADQEAPVVVAGEALEEAVKLYRRACVDAGQ